MAALSISRFDRARAAQDRDTYKFTFTQATSPKPEAPKRGSVHLKGLEPASAHNLSKIPVLTSIPKNSKSIGLVRKSGNIGIPSIDELFWIPNSIHNRFVQLLDPISFQTRYCYSPEYTRLAREAYIRRLTMASSGSSKELYNYWSTKDKNSQFSVSNLTRSLTLSPLRAMSAQQAQFNIGFDSRIFSRSSRAFKLISNNAAIHKALPYTLTGNHRAMTDFANNETKIRWEAFEKVSAMLGTEVQDNAPIPGSEFEIFCQAWWAGMQINEEVTSIDTTQPGRSWLKETKTLKRPGDSCLAFTNIELNSDSPDQPLTGKEETFKIEYNKGNYANILRCQVLQNDWDLTHFLQEVVMANDLEKCCRNKTTYHGLVVTRHAGYEEIAKAVDKFDEALSEANLNLEYQVINFNTRDLEIISTIIDGDNLPAANAIVVLGNQSQPAAAAPEKRALEETAVLTPASNPAPTSTTAARKRARKVEKIKAKRQAKAAKVRACEKDNLEHNDEEIVGQENVEDVKEEVDIQSLDLHQANVQVEEPSLQEPVVPDVKGTQAVLQEADGPTTTPTSIKAAYSSEESASEDEWKTVERKRKTKAVSNNHVVVVRNGINRGETSIPLTKSSRPLSVGAPVVSSRSVSVRKNSSTSSSGPSTSRKVSEVKQLPNEGVVESPELTEIVSPETRRAPSPEVETVTDSSSVHEITAPEVEIIADESPSAKATPDQTALDLETKRLEATEAYVKKYLSFTDLTSPSKAQDVNRRTSSLPVARTAETLSSDVSVRLPEAKVPIVYRTVVSQEVRAIQFGDHVAIPVATPEEQLSSVQQSDSTDTANLDHHDRSPDAHFVGNFTEDQSHRNVNYGPMVYPQARQMVPNNTYAGPYVRHGTGYAPAYDMPAGASFATHSSQGFVGFGQNTGDPSSNAAFSGATGAGNSGGAYSTSQMYDGSSDGSSDGSFDSFSPPRMISQGPVTPRLPITTLKCTSCHLKVTATDRNPGFICAYCSFHSNIRYCSAACLLADSIYHAPRCIGIGQPTRLAAFNPPATIVFEQHPIQYHHRAEETPERFRQRCFHMYAFVGMFPEVVQAWGLRGPTEAQRIARFTREGNLKKTGQYFIFRSAISARGAVPVPVEVICTIRFPKSNPLKWMINRCLCVLFVQNNLTVANFLYRMLRSVIAQLDEYEFFSWPVGATQREILDEFNYQFTREFGLETVGRENEVMVVDPFYEWYRTAAPVVERFESENGNLKRWSLRTERDM